MTPDRWKQIEAVFEEALELPAGDRDAFVQRNCAGDDELRGEVQSLLDSHARAGDFIDERNLFFSEDDFDHSDAVLPAGQLIGPYRVVREIGRGGMGAVYLAERADEQYEKRVAIKLIKRGMDTASVLRHFRNERQILASFDHPNIARLFDGGTTGTGLPYFVMEYIEGVPIDQYCAAHTLSVTERLKLFRDVCAAVSYAHRHTVIHRDIKVSNIVVTNEGVPKLLDFGIAKILEPGPAAEPLMTATGLRPMTPEYASPEQVRGGPVTTASDVYSLGVVLYELLIGRSPYRFTSRSPVDIARAITETEPQKPSTVIAQQLQSRSCNSATVVPVDSPAAKIGSRCTIQDSRALRGDIDNIVLMALRKEPERRYRSVEEFSDDIKRHLEARPVLARKDTMGYRAGKFVRRNKAATAAAALVFLSLLAGVVATTWQAHRAEAEKARAERRFNDVRQLAHSVLFDYHDAIKNLPGATRVRERLVKDALRYLDSLAGEANGDPPLQRELAAAYDRVGDVRGQMYSANLGDRAGAMDSYQKALHIREALVAAAPHDPQNRHDLGASYEKIGNQLMETKDSGRCLEYLRKSLVIYSELASEQPGNSAAQRDLGQTVNAMGLTLEDRGDVKGALEQHRKAIRIYQDLLTANPHDPANRRSLSVSYENVGRALFLANDVKGALENNQKALALREALVAEDSTNADYRRLLGISYQNNGDYQSWNKNIQAALESFRKKLVIDQQSMTADPDNMQARDDFAYSSYRIGELLTESGDHSQALPYYRRALEMYEKRAASDPQELEFALRMCSIRARLGKTYATLGQFAAAREECGKGAELVKTTADDPSSAGLRRSRILAYGDVADAYTALCTDSDAPSRLTDEHWRKARDMYQQSLILMQDLRDRGILDAEEIPEIQKTADKIAACDAALRKNER